MRSAILQVFGLLIASKDPVADLTTLLWIMTTATVARDGTEIQDSAGLVRTTQSCPVTPFTAREERAGNYRLPFSSFLPNSMAPGQLLIQDGQLNMAPPITLPATDELQWHAGTGIEATHLAAPIAAVTQSNQSTEGLAPVAAVAQLVLAVPNIPLPPAKWAQAQATIPVAVT